MASAGNIILNLPTGGKGPYRVAPQGRVFYAQPPQTMQNIAGTLKLVQEAKKVADAVAPFLASEYRPPLQQGEIAAQQLKTAQEAAKQLQQTQAFETALATPLPAQVGEMVQPLPLGMAADRPVRGPDTMPQLSLTGQEQLAPGLSTPVSREAMQQQAMGMPDVAPLDTASLDPAGLQQLIQQQQTLGAQQDIAQAQRAVKAAPPMLPTFDTLAQAEAAIAQAKAMGNYQAIGPMLQGLRYSTLRDVAPSNAIETMNPLIAKGKAIQAMLARLKLPAELTPQRAALQRSAQDIARSGVAARREATEQRRKAVIAAGERQKAALAAADARQKAEIEARKAAAKAAAEAAREYEKLRQKGRIEEEKYKQKSRRKLEAIKAYYQKQNIKLRNAKTPDQLERVATTSEGDMASAQRFIRSYTDHPGRMPPQKTGEKQIDYNRRVAAWKSKTSQYKRALAKYASARIINARARYMRKWMLENPNKAVPANILSGEIPSEHYAPELSEPTPPTNQGGSGGTTTNAPSPPPPAAAAAETLNILKGNQGQ